MEKVSRQLDQHFVFNENSPQHVPLAGTTKAIGKFNRSYKSFRTT